MKETQSKAVFISRTELEKIYSFPIFEMSRGNDQCGLIWNKRMEER